MSDDGSTLGKVSAGDRFHPSAAQQNAILEAVEFVRTKLMRSGGSAIEFVKDRETCPLIVNNTGSALNAFAPVSLGDTVITPTVDLSGFQQRRCLNGNAPTAGGTLAIVLEPIANGYAGRGIVLGLVPAQVNFANSTDGYATINSGSLVSSAAPTANIVVWKDAGTGVLWTVLLLTGAQPVMSGVRITSTSRNGAGRYPGVFCTSVDGLAWVDSANTVDVVSSNNFDLAQFQNDGTTHVIYCGFRVQAGIAVVEWDETSCRKTLGGTTGTVHNHNPSNVQILGHDIGDCLKWLDVDCSGTAGAGVPTGGLIPMAGAGTPAGFVVAAGQALPVANYPNLFAVIGYSYGGAGPVFNVPNLVGHSP